MYVRSASSLSRRLFRQAAPRSMLRAGDSISISTRPKCAEIRVAVLRKPTPTRDALEFLRDTRFCAASGVVRPTRSKVVGSLYGFDLSLDLPLLQNAIARARYTRISRLDGIQAHALKRRPLCQVLWYIRRSEIDRQFADPEEQFSEARLRVARALLHGPEQIADLPVPVAESPGAVRIGHPERSHLVEYLAPNSVFNSLPRQRSSPHLRPDDRLVTIDCVLHHASLGVA